MGIENAKWYILHTYSGYENQVEMNLKMVFEKNNLTERLFHIVIPMEEELEEKNGRQKLVKHKKFPCYVYIAMDYDNSMWHIITQTRGVTGFVGPLGRPISLTDDEVRRLGLPRLSGEAIQPSDLKAGDKVKILSGPLVDFVGTVDSVDAGARKCRVLVAMFGRETPTDIELDQVDKVEIEG